ncbi:MAG: acyltransferase family protein [Devosia sp.]
MSGQNNRLLWVDTAKGISIILVVMMYSVFNVGQDSEGAGLFHYAIGFATPFRMPEFFLISGLFLGQVIARDWRAYADRRAVHYLYFYAIWAVIHIVLKVGVLSASPIDALQQIALAVVEPYGVLWFIYLLAAFSMATKFAYELRAPRWAVFGLGALFQMAHIQTGSYLVDQFAAYFVYFYSGYVFAPLIFRIVDLALAHKWLSLAALGLYALVNGLLVFSPGYAITAHDIHPGYAALPGIRLVLALAGSLAICVVAALISGVRATRWLTWLGEKSIVVYLVFVLPMSFARIALGKIGVTDPTLLSALVIATSILASIALYGLVQWTGRGRFLFERPAWAHIPGTKGSRDYKARAVPAE